MSSSKWKHFEELPTDLMKTENTELTGLSQIWIEQSARLKKSDVIKEFHEKLKREWAIETGVIENLYSLDRGTTEVLIQSGFETSLIPHGSTDKPADLVISILTDQKNALEMLFDHVSNKRGLTKSFIKELHSLLTLNQHKTEAIDQLGRRIEIDLIKGDWKKMSNNPRRHDNGVIHEYCPPEHVESEMDRLVELHKYHQELSISPEIQSAWLHHKFTQIHPFQDGNGRVARCLASLVFIKAGWFPLVVHRDQRLEYIEACENADQGNLNPLINLFAKIQKKSFVKALSLSETLLHKSENETIVIDTAIQVIMEKKKREKKEQETVTFKSSIVEDYTKMRLEKTAEKLQEKLNNIGSNYRAVTESSDISNHYWFKSQIVKIAKDLNYFADTRSYAKWVRLKIIEDRQVEIMVCFHSLGVEFLGIMAVSAFIDYRDRDDESNLTKSIDGPYSLTDEIFQFSYKEDPTSIKKRYEEWLEKAIIAGLDQWRRQI